MKISTVKFLDTICPEDETRSVLEKAKAIRDGKFNDRLGAYSELLSGGSIYESIWKSESFRALVDKYKLDKNDIYLGFLNVMLYSLLDADDASKVWRHLIITHTTKQISEVCFGTLGGAFNGPPVLQMEIMRLLKKAPELQKIIAQTFPHECIWNDYQEDLDPNNPQSHTGEWLDELEKENNKDYFYDKDFIEATTRRLKNNIARYF